MKVLWPILLQIWHVGLSFLPLLALSGFGEGLLVETSLPIPIAFCWTE